jgi:hypothetical protein
MSEQTLQPIPARATAITLEKGDVLVLEYEHRISADTLITIRKYVENRFPGVDAIVLDGGMTLAGVLKPPKAAS